MFMFQGRKNIFCGSSLTWDWHSSAKFMRLARQKQQELPMVRQRMDHVQSGKQAQGDDAVKILELTQHLALQYVTLPASQKRRVVDSVFLNLRLDGVSLCGDYRLPFSILAENGNRPLKSGRQDLNLRPLRPERSALAKLSYSPVKPVRQYNTLLEELQTIINSPGQYLSPP